MSDSTSIAWRPGAYLINGRKTSAYEALCRLRDTGLDNEAALAELDRIRIGAEAAGVERAPLTGRTGTDRVQAISALRLLDRVQTDGRTAEAIAADIRTRAARLVADIVADPALPAGSVEIARVDPDLAHWYATRAASPDGVVVTVMLHTRGQVAAYAARWGVEVTERPGALTGRARVSAAARLHGVHVEAFAYISGEVA